MNHRSIHSSSSSKSIFFIAFSLCHKHLPINVTSLFICIPWYQVPGRMYCVRVHSSTYVVVSAAPENDIMYHYYATAVVSGIFFSFLFFLSSGGWEKTKL